MTDTVNDVVINYKSVGFDQTNAELQGLGKSVDGVVVEFEGLEKSTISVQNQFAALERRFQTTSGQAAQFAKIEDTVNKAVAQNPALLKQGNDILDAARLKYGLVADAEGALGKAHDNLSLQSQSLFHALRGSFEQIAAGVPPTQALTQQINHLLYAASGEGGLTGAFQGVIGILGRMITPMTAVIGGTLGLGAAALYLANSWDNARAEVDQALTGMGERTGTTATEIANFAKANSTAAGLSIADARNIALEFTKTGDIAVSGLKGVGDAIHGYAILTGKDATEATKTFTSAIEGDLVKGIEKIDQRYGALDSTILDHIRELVEAGDKTAALQVYIDATASANKRAEDSVGTLTRAWQGFKNVVSNIVSGPAPTSLQDQLAGLQQQRSAAASTNATGITPGGFLNTAQAFGGKSAELSDLDKQISDLQDKINQFNTQTAVANLKAISAAADEDVHAILPQVDALAKLDEQLKQLQADQNTPGAQVASNLEAAVAVLEHKRQLEQDSLDTTVRQAQVANDLVSIYGNVSVQTALALNNLDNQLHVAQQVTAAGAMKAQSEAAFNALLVQGVSLEEAQQVAAAQLAVAQAQATSNVQRQVEALKDSTAMIKAQQNGTEASTAAAIAYKNAIASGADSTSAAALRSATLANYMAKAAGSAGQLTMNLQQAAQAYQGMLSIAGQDTTFGDLGVPFAPDNSSDSGPGFTSSFDVPEGHRVTATPSTSAPGAGAMFSPYGGNIFSATTSTAAFSPYGADLFSASGANGGSGWQTSSTAATTAVNNLNTSVQDLNTSTKDLNTTMQEALSPYYTQDPRTSHIGFRSQGMASGGWVDVPGSPSANDNMIATVPVASGERIYVDPMSSKRNTSDGGGTTNINITVPVQIVGSTANDQNAIGRTVYQAAQTAARQLKAAQ